MKKAFKPTIIIDTRGNKTNLNKVIIIRCYVFKLKIGLNFMV